MIFSRFICKTLFIFSVMLVAGCSAQQSGSPNKSQANLSVGSPGAGQSAAGPSFAHLEGDWLFVGDADVTNYTYPKYPQRIKVWASVSGNVIDRVIIEWKQRKPGSRSWPSFPTCKSEFDYHAVVRKNSGPEVDCWQVRSLHWGQLGRPTWSKMVFDYAQANGLTPPLVTIGTRFVEIDNRNQRSSIDFAWNAEFLIRPEQGNFWQPDDWTVTNVAADPAKQAVIQQLVRWSEDWHGRLNPAS